MAKESSRIQPAGGQPPGTLGHACTHPPARPPAALRPKVGGDPWWEQPHDRDQRFPLKGPAAAAAAAAPADAPAEAGPAAEA
jgi:hypothetical protein